MPPACFPTVVTMSGLWEVGFQASQDLCVPFQGRALYSMARPVSWAGRVGPDWKHHFLQVVWQWRVGRKDPGLWLTKFLAMVNSVVLSTPYKTSLK